MSSRKERDARSAPPAADSSACPVTKSAGRLGWAAAVGAAALVAAGARRARHLAAVAPDLRSPALLLLPMTMSRLTLPIYRALAARTASTPPPAGVRSAEHWAPGWGDAPSVRVVTYERSASSSKPKPALLWMHGGGFVCGAPEQDAALLARIVDRLDLLIVSVDYRLAPEHPFPAALDDAHAALAWLAGEAASLGVDPARIAVGGQSAGGGLAAALAQRAADHGPARPAFQLLVYPMLDATTLRRRGRSENGRFVWTPESNRFAWRSYLGRHIARDHPAYAVPAARADLGGLPPAWIGVGDLDLFHHEDIEYGRRLREAGVSADIRIVKGGYHGFDALALNTKTSRSFHVEMIEALERGLRTLQQASSRSLGSVMADRRPFGDGASS